MKGKLKKEPPSINIPFTDDASSRFYLFFNN